MEERRLIPVSTLFILIVISLFSCKKEGKKHEVPLYLGIEKRIDSLLALMTLEEKIGQMSQVRHFYDITEEDIATKHIGSVIHSQGQLPGNGAEGGAISLNLQQVSEHGSGTYKLTLPEAHQKYISTYADQGVKVISILISGRPLVATQQIKQSDAFIAAWLPGSEGDGIAEVLFGEYDFQGKLPHSWPKSVDDYKEKYGPNFWNNSITPLYPLGYGLQYEIIE